MTRFAFAGKCGAFGASGAVSVTAAPRVFGEEPGQAEGGEAHAAAAQQVAPRQEQVLGSHGGSPGSLVVSRSRGGADDTRRHRATRNDKRRQSTNTNSFDSNNTWQYFSHGDISFSDGADST